MDTTAMKQEAALALARAGFSKNRISICLNCDSRTVTTWIKDLGTLNTSINTGTLTPLVSTPDPNVGKCILPPPSLNTPPPPSLSAQEGRGVIESALSKTETGAVHQAHLSLVRKLREEIETLVKRIRRADAPGARISPADTASKLVTAAERLILLERRLLGVEDGVDAAGGRVVFAVVKVVGDAWRALADGHAAGMRIEAEPDEIAKDRT